MADEREAAREAAAEAAGWQRQYAPVKHAVFCDGFDAGADWQREQSPDVDRTIELLQEADLLRDNALKERDEARAALVECREALRQSDHVQAATPVSLRADMVAVCLDEIRTILARTAPEGEQ